MGLLRVLASAKQHHVYIQLCFPARVSSTYLSALQHERTATDDLSLMIGISHHRTSYGNPSHDAEGATREIPGSEI